MRRRGIFVRSCGRSSKNRVRYVGPLGILISKQDHLTALHVRIKRCFIRLFLLGREMAPAKGSYPDCSEDLESRTPNLVPSSTIGHFLGTLKEM